MIEGLKTLTRNGVFLNLLHSRQYIDFTIDRIKSRIQTSVVRFYTLDIVHYLCQQRSDILITRRHALLFSVFSSKTC